VLRTRIPRGRGTRRFKFLPLTERELEALEPTPHLARCSCGKNGDSARALAEIEDLLQVTLQHGHELVIEPRADDYALDIGIGSSALGAKKALGTKEITTLESAPYAAPAEHRPVCEICRWAAPLPLGPVMTLAAIALNHGHAVQLQSAAEGLKVTVTIERNEAFDRPSGPEKIDTSAVEFAMRHAR
jgi:hypothetical protein